MKPPTLREIQKNILPKKLHKHIFKAFDQIGTVAIFDVPAPLVPYEQKIAQALIKEYKIITTVCKKTGARGGVYRRQPLRILAGKKTYETIHKENGVRIALHIADVYFSPRLSTERMRITQLVKKGEDVLVMFSGCFPYGCVIAKHSPCNSVTGVEKNPVAHRYALKNVALNKIRNAHVICGDVRDVVPKLHRTNHTYHRIIMALPFKNLDYFDVALLCAKKGTVIHYYDVAAEEDFSKVEEKVRASIQKHGRKCKILLVKKSGQHSPRVFRVVVDVLVTG